MFDKSFLFIPFNKVKYFYNESVNQSDVIIVDFEDSVEYKLNDFNFDEIKKALKHISRKKLIARIGVDDYFEIVKLFGLDSFMGVMIPKVINESEIIEVMNDLSSKEKNVYLLIESAKGLLDLQTLISKYKIHGVFFGSEDYISNLNAIRSEVNLYYARAVIVNHSKAYNIPCYDTIYPFLNDEYGLKQETKVATDMGFDGKMAIHPRQISIINEIFNYTPSKIAEYKTLINDYNIYTKNNNTSIMVFNGTVIEPPHIKQMKSIIKKFEGRKSNE